MKRSSPIDSSRLLWTACLLCLGLVHCKEEPPVQTSAHGESASTAANAVDRADETAPAAADSIRAAISRVVEQCKLDDNLMISECGDDSFRRLKKKLSAARMAALPDIVEALHSSDAKTERIAASLMKTHALYFMKDANELDYTIREEDKRANPIDQALARRIVDRVLSYDPEKDFDLLRMTFEAGIDAAMLARFEGDAQRLLARIDPTTSQAARQLYFQGARRLMLYGRLTAFPQAKAFLEHHDPTYHTLAFENALLMSNWTGQESEEVCRWAGELLKKDEPRWNAGPARVLLRCNDANTWRNILLDEATRRYNASTLDHGYSSVLCRICAPAVHQIYPPAGKTVCDRGQNLFKLLTEDVKGHLDTGVRQNLIRCMPEQWQSKDTLTHLEKLAKQSKDPLIVREAERAITTHTPKQKQ